MTFSSDTGTLIATRMRLGLLACILLFILTIPGLLSPDLASV
jgi:hypothetical protein